LAEGVSATFDCQRALEAFLRLRNAYDPRIPETEEKMLTAFRKFGRIGYDAYFQGVAEVSVSVAVEPLLADMWKFGFDAAEFDAATLRCKCNCDKAYVWGKGFPKCPRIPQGTRTRSH
jgi:hypothetical protein